jgi:hypothetical protein
MSFGDFFEHLGAVQWAGVIVGTLALMVFGFLWYGPIFGRVWAKATGTEQSASLSGMTGSMVSTLAYLFVFNLGIAYLVPFDDFEHALVWGVIVGILLIGPALYSGVVWLGQKTAMFVIGVTHWLLAAAIATYVQGLFA